jgi:presenilin-like A22 family membrane protease
MPFSQMKNDQRHIIASGLGMLACTLALTFFGARQVLETASVYTPDEQISLWYMLFLFLLVTAGIVLLLKFVHGRMVFHFFFTLAMFVGVWFIADIFLSGPVALVAGAVIVALRYLVPRVATQNLLVVLGISGVAISLGLSLPWETVLVLSVILAVYDIGAVYWSKHMVRMMQGLAQHGVLFAAVLPTSFKGFGARLLEVRPGEGAMLIGTGDFAIPAIFIASLAAVGNTEAVLAGIGALFGFAATNELFFGQKKRKPMPALPPIVAGMAIGFLIAFLLR